jgi:hypothetical protein
MYANVEVQVVPPAQQSGANVLRDAILNERCTSNEVVGVSSSGAAPRPELMVEFGLMHHGDSRNCGTVMTSVTSARSVAKRSANGVDDFRLF